MAYYDAGKWCCDECGVAKVLRRERGVNITRLRPPFRLTVAT